MSKDFLMDPTWAKIQLLIDASDRISKRFDGNSDDCEPNMGSATENDGYFLEEARNASDHRSTKNSPEDQSLHHLLRGGSGDQPVGGCKGGGIQCIHNEKANIIDANRVPFREKPDFKSSVVENVRTSNWGSQRSKLRNKPTVSFNSGQNLSLLTNGSARRSLNFDNFASRESSRKLNDPSYNVLRKNSPTQRVPFHEMTNSGYNSAAIAKERTSNWLSQHIQTQNKRCASEEYSFNSGKNSSVVTTSSARRSLNFECFVSNKADNKPNSKKVYDSNREASCPEPILTHRSRSFLKTSKFYGDLRINQSSKLDYDPRNLNSLSRARRTDQDIISMDHPYAQLREPPISVKDAGTSPICLNFPRYEGLSGIVTLRSSDGHDAVSNRTSPRSGRLSGIETLSSSISNGDNPRKIRWRSNVRNGVGVASNMRYARGVELDYEANDSRASLVPSFKSPRFRHSSFKPSYSKPLQISSPSAPVVLATSYTKTPDTITEPLSNWANYEQRRTFTGQGFGTSSINHSSQGFSNDIFEYTICSNVSPTFSKVVTSTPCEREEKNGFLNTEPNPLLHSSMKAAVSREADKDAVLDLRTNRNNILIVKDSNGSASGPSKSEDGLSSDDDSVGGDHDFLNDLTIFEYFEKFDELSDDDSDDDQFPSNKADDEPDEVNDDLPSTGGHCIDVLDKESLQVKKKKSSLRRRNKKRKERGLSYVRKDGTVVTAREVKPPCSCKMKCYEKYSEKIRQKLLYNLLRLKLNSQNQFLANHIMVKKTARPQVVNSRRTYTRVYKMPGVNGTIKVCKTMFQATYDIGNRKMRVLAAKIVAGLGIPADDGRQQNSSRQPVSQEHLGYIQRHILSFPAYSSHYTREKSSKLYLSSDLSIRRLYELYQHKCATENLVPVHCNTCRLVFKSYNLSFRKPKSDTCGKCDRLMIQIKTETDPTEKEELQVLIENHQNAAKRVYNEKRKDIDLTKTDASVRTSSFDLQKQLATPHLRNGEAFYSRQLYTYNLTVFTSYLGENAASCYLWDETKAKRGSQEIGSCLLQDLRRIPSTVETAVYYSGRCSGQNNNKTIIFLFTYFIELLKQCGRTLQIFHKFMLSGHSHMEVDSVHGAIERAKKKNMTDIEIPHDWAVFISTIRRRVPFNVIELEQKEMLNLKSLDTRYKIPKKSTTGQQFRMKDVMVFRYSTENPGLVEYKADVMDEEFNSIQILTDSASDVGSVNLKPISDKPIELPSAKLDDLRKLMPYVKQKDYYATFLKTLVPPKKGRKGKNSALDHFEADRDPPEDSDGDRNDEHDEM